MLFKVPSKEIAEDLTHEVFVSLLEYLKKTEHPIDELQGFIYKIARNRIAQYYRTADKDKNLSLIENIENSDYEFFNTISHQITEIELENIVDKKSDIRLAVEAIKKISNKNYQEVIVLRFIQDLSLKEIAKLINKNVSATSVTLYRAIKELRKILEEKKKIK